MRWLASLTGGFVVSTVVAVCGCTRVNSAFNDVRPPDAAGVAPDFGLPSDAAMPSSAPAIVVDGALTHYENEQFAVTVTATDGSGAAAEIDPISSSVVPAGMKLSWQDVGTVAITWTPDWTQAGVYDLPIHAVGEDGVEVSRSVHFVVLNGADQLPNAPGGIIGDVDGDGFADLAGCVGSEPNYAGGPIHYTVDLYFGGPDGFPTPFPSSRRRTWHFDSLTPGSSEFSYGMSWCTVADFDRDGHLDVVLVDPDNSEAGPGAGKLYVIWGSSTRDMPDPIPPAGIVGLVAAAPSGSLGYDPAGQYGGPQGESALVADVNGDGVDDIVAGPGSVAFWFGSSHRRVDPGTGIVSDVQLPAVAAPGTAEGCYGPQSLLGSGDVDGDKAAEVFVGLPTCPTAGTSGLRVVHAAGAQNDDYVIASRIFSATQFGDLDGDGRTDLLRRDGSMISVFIAYPWSLSSPSRTLPFTGDWVPGFGSSAAFLIGNAYPLSLMDPYTVAYVKPDLVDYRDIPNPAVPQSQNFYSPGRLGDVNGDGHNDTQVLSSWICNDASCPTYWIIYGRPPQ